MHGLGLLDQHVWCGADKHLRRPTGTALGHPVSGYEIHHGRVVRAGDQALIAGADVDEGSDAGHVLGTHWHGLLENDGFRRALLARVAPSGFEPAVGTCFADVRAARLDLLGDLVERHLDTDAVLQLISCGVPPGLPFVPPGSD